MDGNKPYDLENFEEKKQTNNRAARHGRHSAPKGRHKSREQQKSREQIKKDSPDKSSTKVTSTRTQPHTREKSGFDFKKYIIHFVALAVVLVVAAIVIICITVGGQSSDKKPTATTAPSASAQTTAPLQIIAVTVQGDEIFLSGEKMDSVESLKAAIQSVYLPGGTISLIDDEADTELYAQVEAMITDIDGTAPITSESTTTDATQ